MGRGPNKPQSGERRWRASGARFTDSSAFTSLLVSYRQNKSIFPAILTGFFLITAVAPPPRLAEGRQGRLARSFYIMGTVATIEVAGPEESLGRAISRAYAELEIVDRRMSLYRPDSDLSRLNRQPAGSPLKLSPATFEVLAAAVRVAEASGGAFDPSVGPLVKLWGFRNGKPGAIPPAREIAAARANVGFRGIKLDTLARTASLLGKGTAIDLDGLAKGYAVDRALAVLRREGAREGLVDLGESSMGFFGLSRAFGIRHPLRPQELAAGFRLKSGTVSTSASYERGFQQGGRWYSHVIDPRSGWPAEASLSATVLAGEGQAMLADALSTAGFVLGPEGALALWQRLGVEGILFYRDRGNLSFALTPGFPVENPEKASAPRP